LLLTDWPKEPEEEEEEGELLMSQLELEVEDEDEEQEEPLLEELVQLFLSAFRFTPCAGAIKPEEAAEDEGESECG
jgi:hypothetical protein